MCSLCVRFINTPPQRLNRLFRQVPSLEKDCYMWRAYIAQHKYRVVLDGINAGDSTAPVLQAIRKVAEYFAQPPAGRNAAIKWFEDKFSAGGIDDEQLAVWSISAATVYFNEGLYENALK